MCLESTVHYCERHPQDQARVDVRVAHRDGVREGRYMSLLWIVRKEIRNTSEFLSLKKEWEK